MIASSSESTKEPFLTCRLDGRECRSVRARMSLWDVGKSPKVLWSQTKLLVN